MGGPADDEYEQINTLPLAIKQLINRKAVSQVA